MKPNVEDNRLLVVMLVAWLCIGGLVFGEPIKIPKSMTPYGLRPTLEEIAQHIDGLERRATLPHLITPASAAEAIQAALDLDGYAYLLPGEYTLRETLTLPRQYGCALIGLGGSSCYVKGKPISRGLVSGGAVVFKWAGPPGVPMVRVLGAEFRIDGLNLHGEGVAEIGLQINNEPRGGMGPGKGYVPYLTVADCRVAVQAGETRDNDNGDVTSFGRLTAYDCGTIFRAVGLQSFEYHFGYVRNARCGVVFDFEAGGGLHVGGGQTLGDGGTLLRLGNVNPVASTFVIRGWHVDAPAAESGFKLVECTDRSWADVTIQAHLPQRPYPTPIAELMGPVSLKLDRCSHLRPESIHGIAHAAGTPVVIADGCRLRGKWEGKKLLTGAGSERLRDCFDESGTML